MRECKFNRLIGNLQDQQTSEIIGNKLGGKYNMYNRKFMQVKEVVSILGVSRASVYRYIEKKFIPSIQLGRRIYVPIEELGKVLNICTID